MYKKIALLLLVALVSAGCVKKGTNDSVSIFEPIQSPEQIAQLPKDGSPAVTPLPITSPKESKPAAPATTISYKGVEGKNALEILRTSHAITTKTFSGVGEYVESINGLKPDSKHFWAFYVNGKTSNVGAGSYVTKQGDTLEWKLEEIK